MERRMSTDYKIQTLPEIAGKVFDYRKSSEGKIVTTNGAFDVIHAGHVKSLDIARNLGDMLIVGLNSDNSIKRYKSALRPILPQEYRAEMLAALTVVDYVVIFDEDDPRNLLGVIKPDVHVKSKSGYTGIEREVVEENGGRIHLLDDLPGLSTTYIVQRIREIDLAEHAMAKQVRKRS